MCTTGYVKRKVSSLNCRSVSTNLVEKGYLIYDFLVVIINWLNFFTVFYQMPYQ